MQLELSLLSHDDTRRPTFFITRPLREHRQCQSIMERVHYVRRYYPELDGETLKVGLTRAASGMAIPGSNELWLNPSRLSHHTIAHEFVHLLQKRNLDIPQGERSCDVFSLARHWTLNDDRPSYVRVPVTLLNDKGKPTDAGARRMFDVAAEAVRRRAQGLRAYIAFFEEEVRR